MISPASWSSSPSPSSSDADLNEFPIAMVIDPGDRDDTSTNIVTKQFHAIRVLVVLCFVYFSTTVFFIVYLLHLRGQLAKL